MLTSLVTSSTRRRLVVALWKDGQAGSVSDLARLAGVSFAGAYRELRAMERAGLAACSRTGSAAVYRADRAHPQAAVMDALLDAPAPGRPRRLVEEDLRVRAWLSELGAPLVVRRRVRGKAPSPEAAVAAGVSLARRDPTVATALPICLVRNRDRLDVERLKLEARRRGQTRATGFLLDMTAQLSGDRRFRRWARMFRDRRVKRTHDFFPADAAGYARKLADLHTPAVARRWHFRMNLGADAFAGPFRKFVSDEDLQA